MGLMDVMMDLMIKSIRQEKREQMMINMMPKMMEGIDIYEFMPKMMTEMLKDITVDDVIAFIKRAIQEKDKFKEVADKIAEANLMQHMMFKVYRSKLGFDETVSTVAEAASRNGWEIPDIRDLQEEYHKAGLSDMTKVKILYFCNPPGGYDILKEDQNKSMSVMMPMGVSVYQTSDGRVEIAAMNLGMMSGMFSGAVKDVLSNGAANLEKTLEGVVE
ncbi:MAG: DUF302 domain-containing protein [Candidatus Sifarchaeia archaeon]|jgi:uncharacterized protein (DUF302 family)